MLAPETAVVAFKVAPLERRSTARGSGFRVSSSSRPSHATTRWQRRVATARPLRRVVHERVLKDERARARDLNASIPLSAVARAIGKDQRARAMNCKRVREG